MAGAADEPRYTRNEIFATLLIAGLALLVRAVNFPEVFLGDGKVQLDVFDGSIHARRALFSFENFPAILYWDSYIAYPQGAPVPMPPLYDWLLAAVARLFGRSLFAFEHVAAWFSPALSALTVPVVVAAGRCVGGRGVGLGSAALFALLPMSVIRSRLGDPDHHAAVALLITIYVLLTLQQMRRLPSGRYNLWPAAAHALTVAAMALTWSGSLLFIALGEGIWLLAGALIGQRSVLAAQAAAAAAAACLVAPWVVAAGTPIGGPFSSTTLSWLHVTALVGVALVSGALALAEARWPAPNARMRLARAAGLALAGVALLLAFPPISGALLPGLSFLTKQESVAALVVEQRPLFRWTARTLTGAVQGAHSRYGLLAYAIPLAGLAVLARARDRRVRIPALCLAVWTLVLAGLALSQRRFGSDFVPVGAIGFALLLAGARTGLARAVPSPLATAGVIAIAAALIWPGARVMYLGQVRPALSALSGNPEPPAALSPHRTLAEFTRIVRRVTPETSGYLNPQRKPEYGILLKPSYGHAMGYLGRRPTSANNLGPYLDSELFDSVFGFFRSRSEPAALAIAKRLGARYAVTSEHPGIVPGQLEYWLHRRDGSTGREGQHAEHLRLITEGPEGGLPISDLTLRGAPRKIVPYKLFELVEGAVLELHTDPGTPVRAELSLTTPIGRRFSYVAITRSGADGTARLRVPYATETHEPTRPDGPYRLRVGDTERLVRVTDADVRKGAIIPLAGAVASAPEPGEDATPLSAETPP